MASRRASPVRKKKRATAKGGRKKVKVGKPKPAKKKVARGRKKVRAAGGSRLATPKKKKVSRKPAAPARKKKVSRKPAAPARKKKVSRKPAHKTQAARRRSPAPGKWDRLLTRLVGIFGLRDLADVLNRKPSVVRGWKRRGVPENIRLSLRAVDEAYREAPKPELFEKLIRGEEPPPSEPPPPPLHTPEGAARFVADRLVDFVMARQKSEREVTGDAWKMAKESFKQAFGIQKWHDWYDWIVKEYDLEDYIFDYEALRDT